MSRNDGGFQIKGLGIVGLLALLGIGGIILFQSNNTNINQNNVNSPGGSQNINTGGGSINPSASPSSK